MKTLNRKGFFFLWSVALLCLMMIAQSALAQTPVQKNGQLKVCGTKLCNQWNNPIQLRGMSTHGIQWYYQCLTDASLDALANDWGADILRIAMYVQEGGYETNPALFTQRVKDLVNEATARGMYALIDFHQLSPGDPNYNTARAKTFFTEMANTFKNYNNVIYDIANEPNGVSWNTIRNYAVQVIPVIRNIDPDAVVLCGTHGWSTFGVSGGGTLQDVINNPLPFSNVMYTFHFYAASHGSEYYNMLNTASNSLPVFVTEWGSQEASGDGGNNFTMSQQYIDLMRTKKISWCNWNYSDDSRSGAVWKVGTCGSGPWTTTQLKPAGTFVRDKMRVPADDFPGGGNLTPNTSITSPSNGATFSAPANITIDANASDSDGTVSKVDFYSGTTLLGTDTSSPYSFTWSGVGAGSYSLTTKATDNLGAVGTSAAVSITVTGPPACVAAVASADDGNVATNVLDGNLATRWSASGDPQWIQFCLDANTPKNVNGVKIAFYNGNIRQSKFDIQTSLDGISWSNALTNQLSSGTSLNLETFPFTTRSAKWVRILGHGNTVNLWNSYTEVQVQIVTGNTAPTVSITSPPSGSVFVAPALITINANAADADGSVTKVEFFSGPTKVGEDLTAPYSFVWNCTVANNYNLTAVATDNAGATTTSAPIAIRVHARPSVSISSPANGSTFTAPASVTINATASDDGGVAKVEFFQGATKLGEDLASPYSFTWSNVSAGTYSLTARVTDNDAATATSAAVSITVEAPPSGLPAPWSNADIGAVGAAGSATHSSGTFTVNGSGADIWGTADEFHFVHQSASGDVELIARVSSISNTHAWAKAGLMVRETLGAGSINAAVFVSSASGVTFQRRTATGGTSVSTVVAGVTAPVYLKLTRSGNNFTASYSTNGTTYTTIGTQAVTMGASTQVGLAVTSHLDGTIATAPFTNVSVTGPVAPCPAVIDSGNDGNVAANVLDNDMLTRWSSSGDGQWIQFCLGTVNTVSAVDIAFYKGNERQSIFDVLVSTDGTTWVNAATGLRSSGTSLAFENFTFAGKPGKYVRILGHGNSLNLWNSYTEVRITSSPVSLKVADESASSENLTLKPYPNPASGKVAISYTLKQSGRVKLTVFNSGNHRTETLVDEIKDAGTHETILDTQDFKSGLHVIKIIQNGEMRVQKLIKK